MILYLESHDAPTNGLARHLQDAGLPLRQATSPEELLALVQQGPPSCLIVALDQPGLRGASLIEELRADNFYGHIPVVALLAQDQLSAIAWTRAPVDDYLLISSIPPDAVARIRLVLDRAQRDLHANPLSGLPGNVAIMQEAQRRIGSHEPFAMAYFDLDHFKAYNDCYGFARGDEVLRMTARLIVNAVSALERNDTHVGHVGGDDFVFMLPAGCAGAVCGPLLQNFDLLVPNFYDDEDRARGHITSKDRRGAVQQFPLISASIGVVDTGETPIEHVADLTSRIAEVKRMAKSLPGSQYFVDRRV